MGNITAVYFENKLFDQVIPDVLGLQYLNIQVNSGQATCSFNTYKGGILRIYFLEFLNSYI